MVENYTFIKYKQIRYEKYFIKIKNKLTMLT